MTREEAIEYFKRSFAIDDSTDDARQHNEAIEVAIQALEREPCEDAVSREAVLNILLWVENLMEQIHRVRALPSVTQKSGKWIIDKEVVDKSRKPTTYHFETHCSECGFKYAYTTDKEDSIPTNYCPNCGAKMSETPTD